MVQTTKPTRPGLKSLLIPVTLIVGLFSVAARLGQVHWFADLLSLFLDSYFFLALFLTVIWLVLRKWFWFGLSGFILLLNGVALLPYVLSQTATKPNVGDVKLYVHNLYYLNEDLDFSLKEIQDHDPDIIFLMEYSEAIQAQIEASFAAYPYRLIQPSRFTMGLALFSRVPIVDSSVVRSEATRIPIFKLSFEVSGKIFSFVGAHPWPPLLRWGEEHRRQMAAITQVAQEASHPLIVAGDFNASPWSFVMRQLVQEARLRDAKKGYGLRKSWRLNPLFRLPLDHVLLSEEWQVISFQHGKHGASDHDPLILELKLRE